MHFYFAYSFFFFSELIFEYWSFQFLILISSTFLCETLRSLSSCIIQEQSIKTLRF